jgi:hypothetical protein
MATMKMEWSRPLTEAERRDLGAITKASGEREPERRRNFRPVLGLGVPHGP